MQWQLQRMIEDEDIKSRQKGNFNWRRSWRHLFEVQGQVQLKTENDDFNSRYKDKFDWSMKTKTSIRDAKVS